MALVFGPAMAHGVRGPVRVRQEARRPERRTGRLAQRILATEGGLS